MIFSRDVFWWDSIAGPQSLVQDVAEALAENRMVLLQIPASLPWRHRMRNAVLERLEDAFCSTSPFIEVIDAEDDCPACNIGDYLLERFADWEVASGYRKKAGRVQDYLVQHHVLDNKVIWVKGIAPREMSSWLDFCRNFPAPALERGLFVLENRAVAPACPGSGLAVVDFARHVGRHDVLLFTSFVLAQDRRDLSMDWREYVAVATSHLCEYDAELASALIDRGDWSSTSPIAMLESLAGDVHFAARGREKNSDHVLALLRAGAADRLEKKLWRAQIEILFPLIEMYRVAIIERLSAALVRLLKDYPFYAFGKRVTDPGDLELGGLVCLMATPDDFGDRLLYVPGDALRNCIHVLHDCRNLLAHRQCCPPDRVDYLLTLDLQAIL